MNSILVLGGTAFVSQAVSQYFIKHGYTVDILTRGFQELSYTGVREHLIGNRQSYEEMNLIMKDKQYDYVMDITAYKTYDILPVLKALNTQKLIRYVFCSSGGVYSSSDNIIQENAKRVENLEAGEYCLNKKKCEDLLFEYHTLYNLPITILRPSYIYGKGNNQYREGYYFDMIHQNKSVKFPVGKQSRVNFIHIDDLVKQFHSTITNDITIGKAYNATMSEEVTWTDYINAIEAATGKRLEVIQVTQEMRATGEKIYFPFHDSTYLLSNDLVAQDGLYMPTISLREGMKMSYEWYLEHGKMQF